MFCFISNVYSSFILIIGCINYWEMCSHLLIYAFSFLVLPSLYYYYYYLFDNDHAGKYYFASTHLNLGWLCYRFVLTVYYYRMSWACLRWDCPWVIRSCSGTHHSAQLPENHWLNQLFLGDCSTDFAWILSGCHSLHFEGNAVACWGCRSERQLCWVQCWNCSGSSDSVCPSALYCCFVDGYSQPRRSRQRYRLLSHLH